MTPTASSRALIIATLALVAAPASAADDYKLGPDSFPKEGVPKGVISKHALQSRIFPGTRRDYWVYVPAQYQSQRPACLMVFQDGQRFVRLDGDWRVPVVMDNLINRKEMPVTIGIFVDPGVVPPLVADGQPRPNRSFEYDEMGELYVRFLLEELIPEVSKRHSLSPDANCRGIGGSSSGGIAAFTAAWHRPDAFRRVFSSIGSFVGLRGGDAFPTLVRKTAPKPLRVFLQDGSNDNNSGAGSWWLGNQAMLAALEFAGYEVKHEWGDGGHSPRHAAAILPDALRWLWKDFPAPIKAGVGSKQSVLQIVTLDQDWQVVAEGFQFTEGPASNGRGELYFSDLRGRRIHKVGTDGRVGVFVQASGGANGLMFGPDGRLYAAQSERRRVVAYDPGGREVVVAEGIDANDLAVSHRRFVWVSEPAARRIWVITPKGEKRVVDTGILYPNGVALGPDHSLLFVADTRGRHVYSFQVFPDGGLAHKQPYCHLHLPADRADSGADGLAVDVFGRLYVATHLGVQICDQGGKVTGIIPRPQPRWLANIEFGGAAMDQLYATASDKLYRRLTKTKGALSFETPVRPPTPRP